MPFPDAMKKGPYDSLLELQWAFLLHTLNIPVQHHPGSIALPNGQFYEPDFYLPGPNQIVEVKGYHHNRIHKTRLAASLTDDLIVIAHPGLIPPTPEFNHLTHELADWLPAYPLIPGYGFAPTVLHTSSDTPYYLPASADPLTDLAYALAFPHHSSVPVDFYSPDR